MEAVTTENTPSEMSAESAAAGHGYNKGNKDRNKQQGGNDYTGFVCQVPFFFGMPFQNFAGFGFNYVVNGMIG